MNKKFVYTSLALALSFGAMAQDKNAIKFSAPVNKDRAYDHLSILASDEYEGRETGKKGAWMAAEYIKKQFQSFGLVGPVKGSKDPYLQPVGILSKKLSDISLAVGTQTKENLKDYYVMAQTTPAAGFNVKASSIIFAGYGLNKEGFNEYAGIDVAGKVVLIFATGDPTAKTPAPTQGRRGQ
ncbi:MAG: peptidase, partial [Chitinophagaceae bacterium]